MDDIIDIGRGSFNSVKYPKASNSDLNNLINTFWELEVIPNLPQLSPECELSDKIFSSATEILESGKYQIYLPLKSKTENLNLGDSLLLAKKNDYYR